jgi:predicted PurR-regulated permease PerM
MGSPRLTLRLLQWLTLRLSLPLLVLNGWVLLRLLEYFKTPLTVLIVGAVVAFLLNYPLRWLERYGMKRAPAMVITVVVSLIVLGLVGITLVPILSQQSQALVNDFPAWENSAQQQIAILHGWMQGLGIPLDLSGVEARLSGQPHRCPAPDAPCQAVDDARKQYLSDDHSRGCIPRY